MIKTKKEKLEFGDKVTDVCDTPERNYVVLKRSRGWRIILVDKNLQTWTIHKDRLIRGEEMNATDFTQATLKRCRFFPAGKT